MARVAALAALIAYAAAHPDATNCTTLWFNQRVDHFSARSPPGNVYTYQQRYLVYDAYFNPNQGAIFFYNGNEGVVTLYANNTGLMWENAAAFGALIVFAEHRYYGQSTPQVFTAPGALDYTYLSSQQALADYAVLIRAIKDQYGPALPVITFGGSYGGVLAAMFRAKYPGTVDGAIAASAPLRAFPGQLPTWDSSMYYAVITRNAGAAGGSSDNCAANIRGLWSQLFTDGASAAGRARLSSAFQTCSPLQTMDDALALAFYIRGSFDSMSMGNYPYPSSYITGGSVVLPAFPVRQACSYLSTPLNPATQTAQLYAAVAQAIGVINNASSATVPPITCNLISPNPYSHPSYQNDGLWDIQRCVELQPDSTWFSTNGQTDMFWPLPMNLSFTTTHCAAAWGITSPIDYNWMSTAYDLPSFHGVSNIIFTNGDYDPWGGGGILQSPAPERDLLSFNISQGAHHLDLFFSNPADPPELTAVRQTQVSYIGKWISQAREARQR